MKLVKLQNNAILKIIQKIKNITYAYIKSRFAKI